MPAASVDVIQQKHQRLANLTGNNNINTMVKRVGNGAGSGQSGVKQTPSQHHGVVKHHHHIYQNKQTMESIEEEDEN
jgi:hypothetical protein